MDKEKIRALLESLKENKVGVDDVLKKLATMPFEDIDFAKIDHHRALRRGFAEVVFCLGKTIEQITSIFSSLIKKSETVLLTRAEPDVFDAVHALDKNAIYQKDARIIVWHKQPPKLRGNVLVVSAGTADIPVAEEAAVTAEALGCNVTRLYDAGVAGIHRLFSGIDLIMDADCIVAVAGMEGALASVVGGLAPCPVIAVPTSIGYGTSFAGVTAFLTMLNSCSPNITVVNIDNGFGAGYVSALMVKGKRK